jgi:DNA-binding LacI/PurR family transcriptional regulator
VGKPNPRTMQVVNSVELAIHEGQFPEGQSIPSYRDLCSRHGVSLNTVRAAIDILEAHGLVTRKPRSGIYVCPGAMSDRVTTEKQTLRCITILEQEQPPSRSSFHGDYMAGYTDALEAHDIKLRFAAWQSRGQTLEGLSSERFDDGEQGFLLVNVTDVDLLAQLQTRQTPFVVQHYCCYPLHDLPPHDRVCVNKVKAGFEAVRHLLDQGHRRIGYIGALPGADGLHRLYEGYRAALLCAGSSVRGDDVLSLSTDDAETAYAPARDYLQRRDLPTAVFCATDAIALALLQAARELRTAIPEDLSVIGFNDIREASESEPPLTTMASPRRLLARRSLEALLNTAEAPGSHPPLNEILNCHLVTRASTAPFRTSNAIIDE